MIRYFVLLIPAVISLTLSERAEAFGRKAQKLDFIQAEHTVPKEQIDTLRSDIDWMATLETNQTSSEMLSTLEIPNATPATMSAWLKSRVNFLLSEDFTPKFFGNVTPYLFKKFDYPYLDQMPELELPPGMEGSESPSTPGTNPQKQSDGSDQADEPEKKGVVVMSNMGSGLYLGGKMSKLLLGIKIRGVGKVPVTSPRVGVIQVGEGLFSDKIFGENIPHDSVVRKVFRLTTFFHEARHSDGHGKSLGFLHALCPQGHPLENLNACDRNTNGPYTVGAVVAEHMANNCSGCSEAEREAIRLMGLESRTRIIPNRDGTASGVWDAAPEGQFQPKVRSKQSKNN
ncbi:MAG: hypothetical protein KGQ59_05870 [Bdellovibrionales bacterium]|nr:hypothetical protein [Bdellovibrionales bacterium]